MAFTGVSLFHEQNFFFFSLTDVVSDISSDSDDEPIVKSKQKVPPTVSQSKEETRRAVLKNFSQWQVNEF